MNNLLKILIPFFIVLGLHADQGMLSTISSTGETGSGDVDVYYDGTNVYSATSTNLYKYNDSLSIITSNIAISTNIKKVIADSSNVYIIETTNVHKIDNNLSAIVTSKDTAKSLNSIVLSEDGTYIFAGSTTGVVVIKTSDMSIKAFVNTTNAKDLKVNGDFLYVADDWGGLKVLDISSPELATVLSTISGEYYKIAVENNYIYTVGKTGLSSFDISSPSAPVYKGNNTNINVDDFTSLYVQDAYAYIGNTNQYDICDVSDKIQMNVVTSSTTNPDLPVSTNATTGMYGKIYISISGGGITAYDAISDYDDNASAASANQTPKSVEQLNSNNGIYGNLQNPSDVDFIQLTLQGGRLNASILGLDDINVTLYDSNDTTQAPIASIDSSSSTTPKVLQLSAETSSGIHYLKVENTDGVTTGEYKIIAEFNEDDWPDFRASSELINYGEYIKGNILRGDDSDYFRVDLSSKGGITITSEYSNIVDFDLIKASDNSIMSYSGDLVDGRIYEATDNGIYFIKAKAAANDIENQEYSFRVDFSKEAILAKEDEAPFALKEISSTDVIQSLDYIQIVGDEMYLVNNTTSTLYRESKSALNGAPSATYVSSTGSILSFEVIGDYAYVLTDNRLDILYT
ncbi:MAG: hypothetical protein OQJ77_00095, partial [Thiovulaceae bacterium]|nr:hypothetical protein [Sulfurimonadaceae bacterium]